MDNNFNQTDIEQKAEEQRMIWNKRGFYDVFDILEDIAIVIRKPIPQFYSGFTTYFDDKFVVLLNTAFTLGHERFTAAHELYHLTYDKDLIIKNKIILDEKKDVREKSADCFASEFLMPTQRVIDYFHKIINVKPDKVEERHIIIMMNHFLVSYKAMLVKLSNLGLCDWALYNKLKTIAEVENIDKFHKLIKTMGYTTELVLASNKSSIPTKYIEIIRNNYIKGHISFKKLEELLEFIDKEPEDFDIEVPDYE